MQRVPSCAFCFKPYAFKGSGRPVGQRIPRLLSCGHTFCDGCVAKLAEVQHGTLTCPTCEHRTTLSGGKKQIKDFPTNLYILGILINNIRAALEKDVTKGELTDFDLNESFKYVPSDIDEETTDKGSRDREETKCEECCTNIATSECRKCEAAFCKACFTSVHSSSRTLRSHEDVAIDRRRSGHPGAVANNTCASHDGKQLEFFDKTEEKLVCSLCAVAPQCQGHDLVPMEDMCRDINEKLQRGLDDVKKIQTRLQQSRNKLSALFPTIKTECGGVVQQIQEHFQDLHTKLQAREFGLIREVKAAYSNQSFMMNTAQEIACQNKEIESLIKQGTQALSSPFLSINMGEELLSKLAVSKNVPCALSVSSIQDVIKVSYPDEFLEALDSYGSVVSERRDLELKKLSEAPEEVAADITSRDETSSNERVVEKDSAEAATSPRSGMKILTLPSRQDLVYVTHIKNPCDFMVQHAADSDRLENLMDAINRYCDGTKNLTDVVKSTQVGDMVCAQYSKDRYWYRARVIGHQQRPNAPRSRGHEVPAVEVRFIDYGNTEILPLNRLRKIRPEFTEIPELAMNCSLVDIVPPGESEKWPVQSIKAFGSLTRDKALLMSVTKKSGAKLYIDLNSPQTEPTQDDDRPASVRDALVFLDVARFRLPASVVSPTASFPVKSYKKVVVPEEGATLDVIVTYAESPDVVYVMRDSGKEYADTMRILGQMSAMYSANKGFQWRIMWPYKGLMCAARFSGDKNWYRALVTDVVADQLARVTYVDFGNSEEVAFSEIRRLPDHMVQLPMQALQCSLAAVTPIDQSKGWSDECNTFLSDTCIMNKYAMKVVEMKEDPSMSVVLYQRDGDRATSVNRLLLQNKFAAVTDASLLEGVHAESIADSEDSQTINDYVSMDDAASDVSGASPPKQTVLPGKLMYRPVELPAKTKFEFAITYVDKDCTICGYQAESGDSSLPTLMKHVQSICSADNATPVTQDQLTFKQPCCAEFSEDSLWYRGEVVDFPTLSSVMVDYVDFGNREEVPLTSIKLNAPFLEIPKQCLPVRLDGLPCASAGQANLSEYLTDTLIGQKCVARAAVKSLVRGVLPCTQLTLPDGTDVVEALKEKLLKSCVAEKALEEPESTTVNALSAQPEKPGPTPGPVGPLIPETCLPEEGIPFDVEVIQVDKTNVVYLQRSPPTDDNPGYADGRDPTVHIAHDHLIQLVNISERINAPGYFENKPKIKNVWPNMLCCGCYTQDDLWYRAQVVKVISSNPLRVKVLYIDYGTTDILGYERLQLFPGGLLSLPKQAFRSTVVGLRDPLADEDSDLDEESDSDSVDENVKSLVNAVAGKKLICKVVSFGSPVEVELYERVFCNESYKDVPLQERLTELELMADFQAGSDEKSDDEDDNDDDDDGGDDDDGLVAVDNGKKDGEIKGAAESNPKPPHSKESDLKYQQEPGSKIAAGDENQDPLAEGEEKPAENWVGKPASDVHVGRRQLLTPGEFCLKKESLVKMVRKDESEGNTPETKNNSEEVD